jgi:hypothetical protein
MSDAIHCGVRLTAVPFDIEHCSILLGLEGIK